MHERNVIEGDIYCYSGSGTLNPAPCSTPLIILCQVNAVAVLKHMACTLAINVPLQQLLLLAVV
jgi:hypothetical protein